MDVVNTPKLNLFTHFTHSVALFLGKCAIGKAKAPPQNRFDFGSLLTVLSHAANITIVVRNAFLVTKLLIAYRTSPA